jgi:hypothetical protein
MNFAFENPMTKSEVNLIARDLLTPKGYSELSFGKYFGVTPLVAAYTNTTSNPLTITIENNVEKEFKFNENPTEASGFIVGSRIRAFITGSSSNYMEGVITEITENTVKVLVNEIGGSGTSTSWSFHLVYQIKTPFYKVIFTGEPEIEYMGVNSLNPKYLVYFNLKARCDRPYGFYKVKQTLSTGTSITVNNPGELPVYAGIKFTSSGTGTTGQTFARLFNSASNKITFTNLLSETITINSNLKTLSSSGAGIYVRWMEDDLIFEPGNNVINFQRSTTSAFTTGVNTSVLTLTNVEITFEAPAFIKGE